MTSLFNIYCDESCHLEGDGIPVMVLGAVWCPSNISKSIARDIRAIKLKHGLAANFEVKWTKVSESKKDFYCSLVDYFFSEPLLRFRGLVIPDKSIFNQDHDGFYYKMVSLVLENILHKDNHYHIYLDIKDTRSQQRLDDLGTVLHTDRDILMRLQHVRSHELEQLQLTDLFIGALSYVHRGLSGNAGKLAVIDHIKKLSNKELIESTACTEEKFNLLVWKTS